MADLPRPPKATRAEAATVPAPDAGRFLVFAMLLFALATWILIMAWMSRHSAFPGPVPAVPPPPGWRLAGQALASVRSGTTR